MYSRALKAWTLITSCIILIGYGHGIVPIIFTELPYPLIFQRTDLPIEYRYLVYPSALFFFGQIIYVLFLFVKTREILWASLALLWAGLFLLLKLIFEGDSIGALVCISGIPFMVLSGMLFRSSLIYRKASANEE